MKKTLVSLAAVAVILTGCTSVPTQETTLQTGTAKEVYKEALAFAQTQHPEAVLVGFNNHSPSFDRFNMLPDERDTNGNTSYWSFIFVESAEDLEDAEVNSDEAFAIEFVPGKLLYAGYAETRDRSLAEDSVTGESLLAEDSDEIYNKMVQAIAELEGSEPNIIHIDFNMTPTIGEITAFISETQGYDAIYNYASNSFVAGVRPVEFTSF